MAGQVVGKIVAYSPEGSLISDITAEQLRSAPRGEQVVICCDEHETNGIFAADHQQPPCTLIALLGEDGRLRLEIVGESARMMLGVVLGEAIQVRW